MIIGRTLLALLPFPVGAQTLIDLAPLLPSNSSFPNEVTLSESSSNPRTFFFGDSLSDTGNISDLLGGNGPGYPGSTFSNGPTWVSYLHPEIPRIFDRLSGTGGTIRLDLSDSLDFSTGSATTSTVLNQQIQNLFLPSFDPPNTNPQDRAFLWAGGNNLLPLITSDTAPPQTLINATISEGVTNLTRSITTLDQAGLPNLTVISQINLGLTPRAQSLAVEGAQISNLFNTRLLESLQALPISANLLWIDSSALIDMVLANPGAYGFTNVTEAAAPEAANGIPSTLTAQEQAGYLFYDDIHPTTTAHQHFALFVSEHLSLQSDAQNLNLLTDAALVLDDRFGFEIPGLAPGQSDLNVSTFLRENNQGPNRRQTTGIKADYDFALTDHLLIGGEFVYAEGASSQANLDSIGAGLDLVYQNSLKNFAWETGLGIGHTWGDLDREYNTPGFRASGGQSASTFTAHAALTDRNWTLGSLKASWELGLKHRLVHRDQASESGAASLNLRYESETLNSTIANLELGLAFSPNFNLQLALNPVLFHTGGEISASQREGLANFTTPDRSGYDIHTARASLIYRAHESVTIGTDFVIGTDDLWATHFSLRLRF